MDSLYIVMPAYNEEVNIEGVVREWYQILETEHCAENSCLVVAPSGSTDNTQSILLELKKELPKIRILEDTKKQHGPKVIALYDYAIKNGADYIFQTDSDGQTNSKEFPVFWKKRKEYDAIIGYRRKRGDGKSRKVIENIVCLLLRLYFGVMVKDANAPFRLMKAEVVGKYLDYLPKDYNIPNIMFTTWFAYYHEKLHFEEVSFKARQGGKNSINLIKIFKIGWHALSDFRDFKRKMQR